MHTALDAAALGPERGPNPRVGCVIVHPTTGEHLGVGHHRGAGTPHAEAAALDAARRAGRDVRGATAVVTLEPCRHTGRTPPCTDALLVAGITRVVIAATDPTAAAGGGARVLRAAGVDVVTGVLEAEGEALNLRWLHAVRCGRPHVTWKFAGTLDGRSAAADGTSRWITGEAARADVHRRRAACDAIVVGTGTAIADDPELTVRPASLLPEGVEQPLRVVVGRRDLPPGARLRAGEPALHLRTHDLAEVLAELHTREVRSVWLEGGPRLAAAFWRAGLVDQVLAYLAPALLGAGPPAVADLGITTITDAARLAISEVRRHGEDLLVVASPRRGAAGAGQDGI